MVGRSVEISLKAGKNKALNGKLGVIFWVGIDQYASRLKNSLRVGVKVEDQKVFLSERNVRVVPA